MYLRKIATLAALTALGAAATWAATKVVEMSVQVESGPVRTAPNHFSKLLLKAPYGTRYAVNEERDGWCKVVVADRNIEGWMHKSALTSKRIEIAAGRSGGASGVSTEDTIAAKSGFSEDVEKQYRANHADLKYDWVDKIEKWTVSTEEAQAFAKAGGLLTEEEAK